MRTTAGLVPVHEISHQKLRISFEELTQLPIDDNASIQVLKAFTSDQNLAAP